MRIAQVCPSYRSGIGGVQSVVKELSQGLARKGFEVDILTTDTEAKCCYEKTIDGIKVKYFRSYAPNGAYFFSKDLKKHLALNSGRYNIVHAHNYHAFPALYAAQLKSSNRLVFMPHYHGGTDVFFRRFLYLFFEHVAKREFERADRVICVSNYEKSLVMKKFVIDEEKVVVIPNGINREEFQSLKRRDSTQRILYVGRLENYKGIEYLVKAFSGLGKGICLDIVGKGRYLNALLNLIGKLEIEEKVRIYHDLSRAELLQRYANADLFVLLSRYEAFGISVAEALASGVPCIVANSSALRDWVDNRNCFGVDYPISIDGLVRLMDEVIGKRIEKPRLLTWNEVADKVAHLYSEIQ